MYILGIGDLIKEGIAGVLLLLDTIIYGLISGAYKIFMALASARILSSDAYSSIATSLYAVIGVIMLFVLAYAVIRTIMDPDQATKGEMSGSNLVKGIAIAVIGLAITPTIFEYLYQAQGLFVEHDVIGRIFFRNFDNNEIDLGAAGIKTTKADECQNQSNKTAKTNCYVKSVGGAVAATSIWTAFFYPSNPCDEHGKPDGCKGADDITIKAEDLYVKGGQLIAIGAGVGIALGVAAAVGWIPVAGWVIGGLLAAGALIYAGVQTIKEGQKVDEMTGGEEISLADAYAATSSGESFIIYTGFLTKYQSDGDITYLMGVSTLCGIFALYSFVSFSIDMGVRAAKLAYYQIIAPIPLVLQVLPKFKKNFTQYISSLIQTFMEVFIRISVVYIVVYIICHLTDLFSSSDRLWENNALTPAERYLALALLIMGLIIFAKDAPKVITESLGIQGGMGDFKSLKEKLSKGGFFSAASIAGAGITGGIRGARDSRGEDGMNKRQILKHRIGSAASGMLGAATRNAWAQFGAAGHKKADSFRAARDAATKAADDTDAAREKRQEEGEKYKEGAKGALQDRKDIKQLEALKAKLGEGKELDDKDKEFLKRLGLDEKPKEEELDQKLEELKKQFTAHQNAAIKYSIQGKVVSKYEDLREYLTPVSDPTKEKEKMEFAGKFKKFNGELRDMAYEEEGTLASEKRRQYLQEQQRKVSEYRDGMDDESIRDEVTSRRTRLGAASSGELKSYLERSKSALEEKLKDTSLSAEEKTKIEAQKGKIDDRLSELKSIETDRGTVAKVSKKGALEIELKDVSANISSIDAQMKDLDSQIALLDPNNLAEYSKKKKELETKKTVLAEQKTALVTRQTAINDELSEISKIESTWAAEGKTLADIEGGVVHRESTLRQTIVDDVKAQVDTEYRLSSVEYANAQEEHARLVEKLKKESEAAADLWIFEESQKEGSKVTEKKSEFVSENITYVRKNGDAIVSDGTTSKTVKEMFGEVFGKTTAATGYYSAKAVASETDYVKQNGVIYDSRDKDNPKKVFKCKDKDGHEHWYDEEYVDTKTGTLKDPDKTSSNYRFKTDAAMFAQSPTAPVALTPDAAGGKFGNDAARHIRNTEYGPKAQRAVQRRERQQEKRNG